MRFQPGFLFILLAWPVLLRAETETNEKPSDPWLLCPQTTSGFHNYSPPPAFAEDKKDDTRISALQVENATGDITTFSGDVLIERSQLILEADTAIFDQPKQILDIAGHVRASAEYMMITGERGWFDIKNNIGELYNSQYFIVNSHFQGTTPRLSIEGKKQTLLVDSSFTSCPPEKLDWHLDTGLLKLDHETATGTAKHAVLWFKQAPIFYFPYISFPLGEERRSGFLMPSFGSSGSRGWELSTPWYWNIAPNQDAVLTPRYMNKRGSQLITDYRYLTHTSTGELAVEYLHNDTQLEDKRYLINYSNHSDLGSNIDFDVLLNAASDDDYLDDLGGSIELTNTTHLERNANLKYHTGPWTFNLLAQSYDTIDEQIALDRHPYRRLPQLQVTGSDYIANSDILFSLESEWVDFEHESTNQETGQRVHIHPKFSWPLVGNAWFITPSIGFMHTQYDLIDSSGTEIDIENRNLNIASLDTGLFFEREMGSNKLIQTLEPRLYFLHIPYEDQTSIPLFDTSEPDFSFAQLFRENRFNGIDRVGDTDQVTVALTSRILDKHNGDEFMSISLGQIFYSNDRQVSLNNISPVENESDVVSEFSGRINDWTGRATLQWNPDTDTTDKRSIQLHYQADEKRIFNLAYRFRRNLADETENLEQTDVSFAWPINNRYSLVGRWNYSITEERDIEKLFGIEYESCCWAMRLVSQRYLQDNTEDPYDSAIMFQLIFKGLGSITDKKTTDILKHGILGYQSEY
ncbi:MAG: LPS assembly protein LptD [Gammaproteobacteria bacterium]|nr:LPS assembly protein LptD [Gammaproteobacteria bacterium]